MLDRHRDILNVVVLHKGELLHPLVENKGDAIVEERLAEYEIVKSLVSFDIIEHCQHCHRILGK